MTELTDWLAEVWSEAYGQGRDDEAAGLPLRANPHTADTDTPTYRVGAHVFTDPEYARMEEYAQGIGLGAYRPPPPGFTAGPPWVTPETWDDHCAQQADPGTCTCAGCTQPDTDTRCTHQDAAGQCLDHQGHQGRHQPPQVAEFDPRDTKLPSGDNPLHG